MNHEIKMKEARDFISSKHFQRYCETEDLFWVEQWCDQFGQGSDFSELLSFMAEFKEDLYLELQE